MDASQKTIQIKASASGSGCLCVIGLPLLAAGLFMAGMALGWWVIYFQSASWEQVPADLRSLDWNDHVGSKGGHTYSVSCTYVYHYGDREYTGNRVGVETGSSGGKSLHRGRYDILKPFKDGGKPFMAFVNPKQPEDSLLFRGTSSTMYMLPPFGMIFVFVGGGIMGLGISSVVTTRRKVACLERDPERSWLAERKWDGFSMQGSSRATLIATSLFALFMGIFMSIFIVAMASESHVPVFAILIVGFFTLIPVFLAVYAIYLALRYVKYGNPRLMLAQVPFVPGGPFMALLVIKTHLMAEQGVECTFQCSSRLTTGAGKSRTTTTTILHTETITVNQDMATAGCEGSSIPVRFDIPIGKPERDAESNPSITWILTAKAATPGIDFGVSFDDLPVYNVKNPSLIEVWQGAS